MLAKEVKRIIRQASENGFQNLGFHRTKRGGLGWYHPVDDHFLTVTFRTPRPWNRHWGGFLECRLRIQDQINPRIPTFRNPVEFSVVSLVNHADRETMRRWYNEAAAMTTNPDAAPDYLTDLERKLSGMLRIPLQAPLSAESDNEFLLRFRTEDDVRRWALFILQRIPEWVEQITAQWRNWYERSGRSMKAHQSFLDAIQADPESDVPRLSYADWLADRGDAWSEVIRIQCCYTDGYMPWETADRLEELLAKHQYRFDRGADDLSVYVRFCRGMVEEVQCTAVTFMKEGSRILETFPLVNVLSLSEIQERGMKLANQRELSVMRSLKMVQLADDDWRWIVQSPYLGRVEQLQVAFPHPIDLAWLLDIPLIRQLRVLDLSTSRLDANVLAAFGKTDAASGLETLVLHDTDMDDEMARSLSKVTTFRELKHLSVADNPRLGVDGIASLLDAEYAARLERLVIGLRWFPDSLATRLIESRISSTVRLSVIHSSAGLDKYAFRKRFPNCSFDGNPVGRQL